MMIAFIMPGPFERLLVFGALAVLLGPALIVLIVLLVYAVRSMSRD